MQSILVTLIDELERTKGFGTTTFKIRVEENARNLDNRRSTSKTPVRDAATKERKPWKPVVIDGGKKEGDGGPDSPQSN